ncbi:hypothetical protein [Methanococcus aeolicus]|uniref:hypothetical protein n=1 Tax=Methanococcus aeolicus TaxID=42879 RepID=UPI0021C79EEF|nr:hypothetical protein [Methanococcus aeolicus]UXM84095.1 hypothetical protein N6C89_04850 [Methanococcus aeolicus]
MKKIYSKTGGLTDLKNTISFLQNFTGYIEIENNILFYNDSDLIFSTNNGKKSDLRTILKKLPDVFTIQVYECHSKDSLNMIIENKLDDRKNETLKNGKISESTKIKSDNKKEGIILNQYNDLYNFVGTGLYEINLISKKYKLDAGTLIFNNSEELYALYATKNKTIEGRRALGKIKTLFAVSELTGFIKKISIDTYNNYLEKYPKAILKTYISFDNLINSIKEKNKFKIIKNDSLMNILTECPSLIEVNEGIYIVSKHNSPIYAFYKNYEGDKAYRYIKNQCIFENIEFKIYNMNNDEFKKFKEFKGNKLKK